MTVEVRILKESSCQSLSAKSTLTYQIACSAESEILLRILANSGNGYFSKEWVPLADILDILNDCDKPFAWYVLSPLFKGKSVNTACFLMATLKNEGLVKPLKRSYERMELDCFMEMNKELMDTQSKMRKGNGSQAVKVTMPSKDTISPRQKAHLCS
jgi:hypothetical protein